MKKLVLTSAVFVSLGLAGAAGLARLARAQEAGASVELAGDPYSIHKTWIIGGEGSWDYLTPDPAAGQLFIAHGTSVQIVDTTVGSVVGELAGTGDAHGIALDPAGQFAYVSYGTTDRVRVFDRVSMKEVASIPTGPNPRALVYEPATGLLFAICTEPFSASPASSGQSSGRTSNAILESVVTVIDPETRTRLADIFLPGRLGFAQADGKGQVFINVVDRNQIASFDAQALAGPLRRLAAPPAAVSAAATTPARGRETTPIIDWAGPARRNSLVANGLRTFPLGSDCPQPSGLAIDGDHARLFAACNNATLKVLDSGSGAVITSLPIGHGTDSVAYDASRGLIFTANGGGLGSLTVIQQHVTDSYAVIQELPTRARARTLAVNASSGEIYLVTDIEGFDMSKPGTGGTATSLPVVKATPVQGSFQVLVVGN